MAQIGYLNFKAKLRGTKRLKRSLDRLEKAANKASRALTKFALAYDKCKEIGAGDVHLEVTIHRG